MTNKDTCSSSQNCTGKKNTESNSVTWASNSLCSKTQFESYMEPLEICKT